MMASVTVGDSIIYPPGAVWVLVKGHHDSGTIAAVFGPYTEKWADFLLANMLDCSMYNWTKTRLLKDGSEYEPTERRPDITSEPETAAQRLGRLAELDAEAVVSVHRVRIVQHHGPHPRRALRRRHHRHTALPRLPAGGHSQAERTAQQLSTRDRMEVQRTQESRRCVSAGDRVPLVQSAVQSRRSEDSRPCSAAITRRRRRTDCRGPQIMQFQPGRETWALISGALAKCAMPATGRPIQPSGPVAVSAVPSCSIAMESHVAGNASAAASTQRR